MRVSNQLSRLRPQLTGSRIVEYATREQAQTAVSTLSNQNLMGRLVYVREVSLRQRWASVTVQALVPSWPPQDKIMQPLQY